MIDNKSYYEKHICRDSAQICALGGVTLAVSGLKKSGILVHGSPGCGWMSRWMRSDHSITNYTPVIATGLLEHDIIYGGGPKLDKTVKWIMEKWKPRQLFIINGCTGSLINDPADAIIQKYQREYRTKIFILDDAGFKGLASTGVDDAFDVILRAFAKETDNRDENSVNIIAPFLMGSSNWIYDVEEIKRYLEAIGISVNSILTYNTSVEEIEIFNNAKINLYLTYESLPKLNKYEDEHGFERIGLDIPLPIGIANTDEWFYKIADRFDKRKKAEEFLRNEKKILNRLRFLYNSTWLQTWLSSKYAVVIGPATWAASFANFIFYDLAIYPAVIALYGDSDDTIIRAKEMLKDLLQYHDSIVLENPLYIQVADAVKDAKVEFAIGQTQDKTLMEGYGIAHLTLAGLYSVLGTFNFIPYPSTGYRGVLYLLTMLGKLLENAFHEPAKWKALAYRRRDEVNEQESI